MQQSGPVSASNRSYNNVVAMWQKILLADGYLAASGLDCRFGAATTAATKRWQRDRGLVSDGIVGPRTLARAATRLSTYEDDNWFSYDGLGSNVIYFGRLPDGRWDMSLGPDLEWQPLAYTSATFSICS